LVECSVFLLLRRSWGKRLLVLLVAPLDPLLFRIAAAAAAAGSVAPLPFGILVAHLSGKLEGQQRETRYAKAGKGCQ